MHSFTIQNNTYVCSFKSNLNTESISVYVLDARLGQGTPGQCLSQLSVLHESYISTSHCSTEFQPFEILDVTLESQLHIYFKDTPRLSSGLIWLLVNASEPFNVTCETVERTTIGTSTVTTVNQVSFTDYSIISGSSRTTMLTMTHNVVSTLTADNNTDVAGQSENTTGAIAGGVVATVVAVLFVTLVSVWIIRHRRTNSKREGEDRITF
ncbi:uncharacterized protein LOC124277845 [Haliotis rubra]|uniref:uncharacterized protein LOC124277845 n=1 Tax=Haliotis rubra TaxID=36100 RepID=UPI001EE5A5CD|nr:uncharacterized protein LOC124277845 [Haliotis rubra]